MTTKYHSPKETRFLDRCPSGKYASTDEVLLMASLSFSCLNQAHIVLFCLLGLRESATMFYNERIKLAEKQGWTN
jgi:hypothetical protein